MNIDQTLLREQYDFLCDLLSETDKPISYYENIEGILNILEELLD